jgi:ubiquinone/menaquinone biosynthesis C-methylase UbiE
VETRGKVTKTLAWASVRFPDALQSPSGDYSGAAFTFMKRVTTPELLDADAGTPEEVRDSLEDLRWLNRYFGGLAMTTTLLERVAAKTAKRKLTYLDVGAATGDASAAAKLALARRGAELETILLDSVVSHLERRNSSSAAVVGDALQLPFADSSFDVVGSSLLMHHLQPDEAVHFLNQALRVSRHAVIINDLRRSRVHWLAARAGSLVYRSRITRFDAPASVRQAYTPDEMLAMLKQTNAGGVEITSHYFYRMGVVAWKRS